MTRTGSSESAISGGGIRTSLGSGRASSVRWATGAAQWVRADEVDCEYRLIAPRHAWFFIFDEETDGEERSVNGLNERSSGIVVKNAIASFVPAGTELRGAARRMRSNYVALFLDPLAQHAATLRDEALDVPMRVPMDATLLGLASLLAQECNALVPDADIGDRIGASLMTAWTRRARGPETSGRVAHPQLIRRLHDAIEDDIGADLDAARLGALVGLSPFHLQRVFKSITGRTLQTYITERRLLRARHLLIATSKGVTQIALKCGFSSSQHFATVFRRATGMTPTSFRAAQSLASLPGPER